MKLNNPKSGLMLYAADIMQRSISFNSRAEISGKSSSVFTFFPPDGFPPTKAEDEDDPKLALALEMSEEIFPEALTTGSCTDLLLGMLEVSIGTDLSLRISPPRIFCIAAASESSIGPMFFLVLSNVPGSRVRLGED